MNVKDVYNAIDAAAPFSLAMDFDNPGLLVGDPDEQVKGALVALDGIGPWTAHYLLMRACHHTDGFPAADYGVKLAFPGLTPKEIERASQAWRPYRSYAVMSLWCAPHD